MLRHASGYKLANHDTRAIQAYFGHRNFRPTLGIAISEYDALYRPGAATVLGVFSGLNWPSCLSFLPYRSCCSSATGPDKQAVGAMEPAANLRLATIAGSIGDIVGASTR
jgi:hypothetical protein